MCWPYIPLAPVQVFVRAQLSVAARVATTALNSQWDVTASSRLTASSAIDRVVALGTVETYSVFPTGELSSNVTVAVDGLPQSIVLVLLTCTVWVQTITSPALTIRIRTSEVEVLSIPPTLFPGDGAVGTFTAPLA